VEEDRSKDREAELRAVTVGELKPLAGRVRIQEYDPAWPGLFEAEAAKIRRALGDRAIAVEHAGSTSVAGLAAKPIIDIVLVVADSADEPNYVPALQAAGYVLRIREPDWHQHRMLRGSDPSLNLHVFSAGCPEVDAMLRFRDWLRTHDDDRDLYQRTKRELAGRDWTFMQDYADAKTAVVQEIMRRASAGPPAPEAPA
jgi:GrpB-like predicted nucleotidyltransferase (UPF0157 family)